jgi:hypothetical protein
MFTVTQRGPEAGADVMTRCGIRSCRNHLRRISWSVAGTS